MKFGLVDTKARTITTGEFADLDDAKKAVGLKPMETDHGTLSPDLAYVVYEYGLFVPKEEQTYASIGKALIAGNAVLYAYDERGETVPVERLPPIVFYKDAAEVERAISYGVVDRPKIAVNGVVFWQWPEKR